MLPSDASTERQKRCSAQACVTPDRVSSVEFNSPAKITALQTVATYMMDQHHQQNVRVVQEARPVSPTGSAVSCASSDSVTSPALATFGSSDGESDEATDGGCGGNTPWPAVAPRPSPPFVVGCASCRVRTLVPAGFYGSCVGAMLL